MIVLFAVSACKEHTAGISNELPTVVRDYIKDHLPGWSMIDTFDYDKSWWSFYDKKQVPHFITIDMNDDQLADYGMLLKRSDTLRLVVLINSKHHSFTHQVLDDFSGSAKGVQYGLAIEPPAQIDVVYPEEQSLILQSNAITLMEMELRSRIYYWKDDTVKVFYAK